MLKAASIQLASGIGDGVMKTASNELANDTEDTKSYVRKPLLTAKGGKATGEKVCAGVSSTTADVSLMKRPACAVGHTDATGLVPTPIAPKKKAKAAPKAPAAPDVVPEPIVPTKTPKADAAAKALLAPTGPDGVPEPIAPKKRLRAKVAPPALPASTVTEEMVLKYASATLVREEAATRTEHAFKSIVFGRVQRQLQFVEMSDADKKELRTRAHAMAKVCYQRWFPADSES